MNAPLKLRILRRAVVSAPNLSSSSTAQEAVKPLWNHETFEVIRPHLHHLASFEQTRSAVEVTLLSVLNCMTKLLINNLHRNAENLPE
jgi:hypothetical protein